MIERYSRKEIKRIWEDHNGYSIWLDIELAAAEAMEKLKIIPRGVSKKVKKKAKINIKRILKIEDKVILPHPRMHTRNFVLFPLFELDKDWKHPMSKHHIKNLLLSLPITDINSIKQI